MNVNTGDLYRHLGYVPEGLKEYVETVPEDFKDEVLETLKEQDHVKVDMNKSTPLVDWAKKQQKKKSKRKTSKASRKANRR